MKYLLPIFALCACFNLPAHAACSNVLCQDEFIERLYVHSNGNIYIQMTGDKSALNCTLSSGTDMIIKNSQLNRDEMYALLLSVFNTGDRLSRIRIQDGSAPCEVAYIWQERQ